MGSQVLRIRNVGRRLGDKTVWVDSLDIPRGKVVVIVGASGSGKSSLLHLIGGLSFPDFQQKEGALGMLAHEPVLEASFLSGDQRKSFDFSKGPPPKAFQDRVGFVFQSAYLLQSATASANIALGAFSSGRVIEADTVQQLAKALSIDSAFLAERTSARSGGERQRIAVARAFARTPNLVLADEPTASLDPKLAEEIVGYLKRWSDAAEDRTTVWATHDVHLAAKFSDFVIVLREGRLADWTTWPQVNPGDPAILRRWIDGEVSSPQDDPNLARSGRSERIEAASALTKEIRIEPASRWTRSLFWARVGIAQVFDGIGANSTGFLRNLTSGAVESSSEVSPGNVGGWVTGLLQLWRSFGAKAAVARLALFVTLMIVLWAELDGLAWSIRNSLLSPTLNPVVVSSRATIDESAIADARRTLAVERRGVLEFPDAFGRYEFGSRRVARLRDDVRPSMPLEHCAEPRNRGDREVLLDVAALDPAEPVLGRLPLLKTPSLSGEMDHLVDRDVGLWPITLSREAQRKLVAILGASPETRFVCLEIRSNWITAEVTGVLEETTRGRFAPYDIMMSASQWRDFGTARDRDYYQSAAVYFDVDPARSRQLVQAVRIHGAEVTDPPNTRLVQSLANEAAFERISAALERSMFSQIIIGFLGVGSLALLVLVIWSYISENFQANLKSICVALAFGASFRDIAVVQLMRTILILVPTAALAGLATFVFQQYQVRYSADPAAKAFWGLATSVERFGLSLMAFVAGVVPLTLVFSAVWLKYIRRRSLADQLKELD